MTRASILGRASTAILSLSFYILSGCATAPTPPPTSVPSAPVIPPVGVAPPGPSIQPPAPALTKPVPLTRVPIDSIPLFADDADTTSLRAAAAQSGAYFHQLPPALPYVLAGDTYTARDLADSMDMLVALLDGSKTSDDWIAALKSQFVVYQSNGSDGKGGVTFSSYYEPTLPGRLHRTDTYRYPMYGRPNDLVDVDLGMFDPAMQGARLSGRRSGRKLVPYYTRENIDSNHQLAEQGIEVAWAKDPMDIFFLQIEGSGFLDTGDGKTVRIGYDGDNGRRFRSVGKYLIDTGRVSASAFGHDGFKRYMAAHPKERQALLNYDERYVFFQLDTSTSSVDAYGNIQVPLTAGRSIATDPKIFPKGMLAWVDVHLGAHGPPRGSVPLQRNPTATHIQRFMLNQDEGGAIQGPGRVDFFAGHGAEATHFATHLWHTGTLYFLVKKKT